MGKLISKVPKFSMRSSRPGDGEGVFLAGSWWVGGSWANSYPKSLRSPLEVPALGGLGVFWAGL